MEQHAATMALAVLEKRKEEYKLQNANRTYDKNYQDELSQLERMHFELQRRKSTAQRKERETVELYRRYVSQYGSHAAADQQLSLHHQNNNKRISKSCSSGMPVLHEYDDLNDQEENDDDVVRQTDLLMAKVMQSSAQDCQLKDKQHVGDITARFEDDDDGQNLDGSTPMPNSTNAALISPTKQQSQTLLPDASATITTPSLSSSQPPSATASIANTSVTTNIINNDHDECSETQKSITSQHSKLSIKEILEEASKAASIESCSPPPPQTSIDLNSTAANAGIGMIGMTGMMMEDVDDDSMSVHSDMSGLTMDGATIAEAEFKLLEFLKVETENIRQMMHLDSDTSCYEDEDDVSTLNNDGNSTVRSMESKRAKEAARQAEDMAKQMEEDTAWMKDPSSLLSPTNNKDSEEQPSTTTNKNHKTKSSSKCDWAAYYSDEHKREYYFNKKTNQTTWTKPVNEKLDTSTSTSTTTSTSTSTNNDTTANVVVKDYTKVHEKKKQRQRAKMENMNLIDEFRPQRRSVAFDDSTQFSQFSNKSGKSGRSVSTSVSSRRLGYRRKQSKKRRKRRIRIAAVLFATTVGLYYTKHKWVPTIEKHTGITILSKNKNKNTAGPGPGPETNNPKQKEKKKKRVKVNKTSEAEQQRLKEQAQAKAQEEEAKKIKQAQIIAAAKKKAQEEEEAKKKAQEAAAVARKKAQDEREAEFAKKKAQEEQQRKKKQELAAKKKKAEEERKQAELLAIAKKKAEAAAAAKKAEEERKKKEAEIAAAAAKKAEEERERRLKEAKRKEVEIAAKIKAEEEKLRKMEEARQRREQELAAKAAEEERLRQLELERKREEAQLAAKRAEEDRIRKLEEQKQREKELARKEAIRKAQEERQRKIDEERIRENFRLQLLREEEERIQAIQAEKRMALEEAKRTFEQGALEDFIESADDTSTTTVAIMNGEMKRPKGCLVPLSYTVSKKCSIFAKVKPIYDLKSLTDSMMQ